jgi:hypothetical protein
MLNTCFQGNAMFFIIWGSRNRFTDISRGEFFCPNCNRQQWYVHRLVKRWFTLYFVPLFPIETAGEFIECSACNMTFHLDVLYEKSKRIAPVMSPMDYQMRLLRDRLDLGGNIEDAVQDLTRSGLDRQLALEAVKSVTGDTVKQCTSCWYTYAPVLTTCPECKKALREKPLSM